MCHQACNLQQGYFRAASYDLSPYNHYQEDFARKMSQKMGKLVLLSGETTKITHFRRTDVACDVERLVEWVENLEQKYSQLSNKYWVFFYFIKFDSLVFDDSTHSIDSSFAHAWKNDKWRAVREFGV